MDLETNIRPQDGRSASAGGTRTGFSDSADSQGAWSERSDGGLLVPAGRAFRDDITGAALPSELVTAARAEEIKFTQSWNVWDVRPVSECKARTVDTWLRTSLSIRTIPSSQPLHLLKP
eukprot:3872375-Alexandrium_andersonii.AAC.1